MNIEEVVAKFLLDHLGLTVTLLCLSASVKLANFLAKKWPIPPTAAPWWKRAAHFLLVNWPQWGDELEGEVKGLQTSTKAMPFVSFTARPATEHVDKAREVLDEKRDGGYANVGILLCIAASAVVFVLVFLCSGCGPDKAYVRALQIKGEASDAVIDAHVGWGQVRQMMHDNIRAQATSLPDGLQQLDKLRQREAKADAALIVGRDAVRAFSAALAVADAAKRKDWTAAILQVVTAITAMVAALSEFNVRVKWQPPAVNSEPVTRAIRRGFDREMARANKCYALSSDGARLYRVGCEFAALGGAR